MLGAPPEDRQPIRRWSNDIASGATVAAAHSEAGFRAFEEFVAYIRDLIAVRRKSRHTDLLASLMDAEEGGDRLSHDELVATFMQLLWAGHETTTNLIGNLHSASDPSRAAPPRA
jgi:cytochrome P450